MEKIPEKIAEKLPLLPDHPGIYLWKNAEGEIIYIGKLNL
jgi:excinuclease UvrABC nuclease subunit